MMKITSTILLTLILATPVRAQERGTGFPERAVRLGIKFSGSHSDPSLSVGSTKRTEEVVRHRYGAPYFEPLYFELIGKLEGQQDPGLLYAGTLSDPRFSHIERNVKGEKPEKSIEYSEEGTCDLVLPDVAGAILRIWKRTPEDRENPRKKLLETNL